MDRRIQRPPQHRGKDYSYPQRRGREDPYPQRQPRRASYRQYAARRRVGGFFQMLGYLFSVLLIAAAVFLILNGSGLFDPGASQDTQPVAAAAPSPTPEADNTFVVAVDPGHGGGDPGTEGVSFYEDEMTWDTADRLIALLQADDRFSAFLTTDGTEYEKPSERAANTKAQGAQLLISIHGNSGDDPSYTGFECYPVPPGRSYNAESLAFAEMIARRFGDTGERLRGENGVRYIYYDENNEKQIYEVSDTTVHTDPTFTLLEECGCPAVLAEQCFITSPQDVDAFGDDDGRQAAAQIYYEAICEWYETYVEGAGTDSGAASADTGTDSPAA